MFWILELILSIIKYLNPLGKFYVENEIPKRENVIKNSEIDSHTDCVTHHSENGERNELLDTHISADNLNDHQSRMSEYPSEISINSRKGLRLDETCTNLCVAINDDSEYHSVMECVPKQEAKCSYEREFENSYRCESGNTNNFISYSKRNNSSDEDVFESLGMNDNMHKRSKSKIRLDRSVKHPAGGDCGYMVSSKTNHESTSSKCEISNNNKIKAYSGENDKEGIRKSHCCMYFENDGVKLGKKPVLSSSLIKSPRKYGDVIKKQVKLPKSYSNVAKKIGTSDTKSIKKISHELYDNEMKSKPLKIKSSITWIVDMNTKEPLKRKTCWIVDITKIKYHVKKNGISWYVRTGSRIWTQKNIPNKNKLTLSFKMSLKSIN